MLQKHRSGNRGVKLQPCRLSIRRILLIRSLLGDSASNAWMACRPLLRGRAPRARKVQSVRMPAALKAPLSGSGECAIPSRSLGSFSIKTLKIKGQLGSFGTFTCSSWRLDGPVEGLSTGEQLLTCHESLRGLLGHLLGFRPSLKGSIGVQRAAEPRAADRLGKWERNVSFRSGGRSWGRGRPPIADVRPAGRNPSKI